MTPVVVAGLGFVAMLFFIAIRMPVGLAMLVTGSAGLIYFSGWNSFLYYMNSTPFYLFSNYTLSVIPLFILMGAIAERSGLSTRLFTAAAGLIGHWRGGLAMALIGACAAFGAICGSSVATTATFARATLPEFKRYRYAPHFATGAVAVGGTLGILIPPSIMLIVYAAASGVSIVRLYAGALLPGFLLAGLYLVYVIIRAILQPNIAPKPRDEDVGDTPLGQLILMILTSFVPLAFLILAVLGSILFGLATPSEAASAGAIGGLLLAVLYRALTWQRLRESVYLTLKTTAMVCWLFVGSWVFASVFSYLGGERLISEFVTGLDISPITFLIMAQLIIFLLGWPLEWSEIIIIFVPIFLPLLSHFGVDPLFFGVLVALNLQTSFLTPPMAMSAYYLKGIAPPHVRLTQIFAGCMPYLAMVFLSMLLIYLFPSIVFALPELVYGR